MAKYRIGFCTTLLPRPNGAANEGLVWTVWGGAFAIEGGATHNGERVWNPTIANACRAQTPSLYWMCGFEASHQQGTTTNPGNMWLAAGNNGATNVWSLRCDSAGNLALFNGTVQVAISTTNPITTNTNYYTTEVAWANTPSNISYETRVNGLRIAALTSSDFGATGVQPAGTGARPAPQVAGNVDRIILGSSNSAVFPTIYYYWQKSGTQLWDTVATVNPPTTLAQASDFLGLKKRAWIFPNTPGNYPIANWINGLGVYPASIADSGTGFDGDITYIKNVTSGTTVSADKISHHYTILPGTAANIGFVQRTVIAEALQVPTLDTIRMGVRSPSTAAVPNTDFYLDSTGAWFSGAGTGADTALSISSYGTGANGLLSVFVPDLPSAVAGQSFWTPTLLNATNLEGLVEQRAFA